MSSIDTQFLNGIYQFLKNNRHWKIWNIQLHICLDIKDSNIFPQCDIYKSKFQSIGFDSWVQEHTALKTQCLVIRKEEEYPYISPYLEQTLELAKQHGII